MLRNIVVALLLLLHTGALLAADLVPGSTSPDGHYALTFVCLENRATDPPPTVWFVRLPDQTTVSTQLVPHDEPAMRMVHGKGGTYAAYRDGHAGANQEDCGLMFDLLTSQARDTLQGKAHDEAYRVLWSNDGQQATIWVASHKFQHASVYRLRRGRFYRQQDLDFYEPPGWRSSRATTHSGEPAPRSCR